MGQLRPRFNGASTTWSRMVLPEVRRGLDQGLQRSLDHVVEDGLHEPASGRAGGHASTEPRPRGRGWSDVGPAGARTRSGFNGASTTWSRMAPARISLTAA